MANVPARGLSIAGCSAPAMSQAGWIVRFDASGACHHVTTIENGFIDDLAVDAAGATYAGGEFNRPLGFGDGTYVNPSGGGTGTDVFLGKYDAQGTFVWGRTYGDASYQRLSGLAVRTNRVVLVGDYEGTMDFGNGKTVTAAMPANSVYLARIDTATGNPIWARTFYGTDPGGVRDVAFDGYGDEIVVGTFQGELRIAGVPYLENYGGNHDYDGYVAKFDGYGKPLWARAYGPGQFGPQSGPQPTLGFGAVAATSSSRIVVVGDVNGEVDFGKGATTPPPWNPFLVRFYQ
jgi:hypothetical protein